MFVLSDVYRCSILTGWRVSGTHTHCKVSNKSRPRTKATFPGYLYFTCKPPLNTSCGIYLGQDIALFEVDLKFQEDEMDQSATVILGM